MHMDTIPDDSELQKTTYQIQKYTITEFVVGAKTGRACDIIARFNNEETAKEYCRQAEELQHCKTQLDWWGSLVTEFHKNGKCSSLRQYIEQLAETIDHQAKEIAHLRDE